MQNECLKKKPIWSIDIFLHALSLAAGLSVAFFASHSLAFGGGYWLLFATFVMGQTNKGAPLTLAARYFLLMLIGYLLAFTLMFFVHQIIIVYFITAIVFIVSGTLLFILQPAPMQVFFLTMLVAFVFMLAVITVTPLSFYNDILQIVIGSIIGIISVRLFFPINWYRKFAQGVLPILEAYLEYSKALASRFYEEKTQLDLINRKRWLLEKVMQSEPGNYPEWIFEVGFNPGLRAGFRYFLLQLDKIGEIFFSLDYLAFQPIDPNFLSAIQPTMINAWHKNEEILQILFDYFKSGFLANIQSDFTTDITDLEKNLQKIVPKTLDLLDISPDYVTLTSIVRDIKDLRELLLQAVMALPKAAFETFPKPTLH